MKPGIEIHLLPDDRKRLGGIIASGNSPQKHAWRACIVLLSADGVGAMEIQRLTGKGKPTILRWQRRFMEAGVVWTADPDGIIEKIRRRRAALALVG